MSKVTDFRGTEFALAFAETAISLLVRRRSGTWECLDSAPVSSGHLNAAMAQMRRAAPGHGRVHVFLPPEHVLSCRVPPGREVDVAAQFAARTGCDAGDLAIVHWRQPATGHKLAIAADRTTITEAAAHAVSWGFRPVSVGVHPETMPDGAAIRFPFKAPDSARRPSIAAAAIGTLVLLGGTILSTALYWPGGQPRLMAASEAAVGDAIAADPAGVTAVPEPAAATPAPARGNEPVPGGTGVQALKAPPYTERTPLTSPMPGEGGPDRLQPSLPRVPAQTSPPAIEEMRPRVRMARAAGPLPETADIAGAPVLAAAATDTAGTVRLAALTPTTAPIVSDARPLAAIAPAGPLDEAPGSSPPEAAAPSAAPGIDGAAPRQAADSAVAPDSNAAIEDPAAEAAVQPSVSPTLIDGPRSSAPPARPDGLVEAAGRALAAGPRSPAPQARPPGLVRRVAALRRTQASGSPGSPDPAAAATVSGTLPVEDTGLLGIVTRGNRRMAIVMLPSGEIARVGNGDRVGGWTVATINDDYIRLTGSGGRRTLRLLHR